MPQIKTQLESMLSAIYSDRVAELMITDIDMGKTPTDAIVLILSEAYLNSDGDTDNIINEVEDVITTLKKALEAIS